ncbi:PREDICTED: integrator complex subunit 5 isoform X1 [Rhagoletis zephyria]|uniref:integrator complex subunit 5 isoform X1 n=1 Tax=Rhagoletis zephyria TaxID=28612 RepID=UPI0008119595|nr:PREDICTED: integrator complex subunit 5 isoform X1 [Rhagoletis zephyria]
MLKQHVLVELKQFVQAVTSHRGNQKKLTNTSLLRSSFHLLEDLPAAREIIFEYFSLVAEVAVQNYVANANVDYATGLPIRQGKQGGGGSSSTSNVPTQPTVIEDSSWSAVQEALENLVVKGPSAWGPVIASWSLDLVGKLSDKYTKRKMSIVAACNYWLNCGAMRGLLTLISLSFRKLSNTEKESCVETLLAAFQRYSLSFDWVVARLGGCFPLSIISQILQCSLKRFAEDYRCRFDSELGILDYLSFAHEQELKQALTDLLKDGFNPKKTLDACIIPFLLVMATFADALLQNLVVVFLEMYNDDLRQTIIQKSPLWMSNKMFAEMQPSLNSLALRLKSNGAQVLIAVSQMAEQFAWCQDFLEYTMQDLEQVVLNATVCPLMNDLATEESKYLLWKSCLNANIFQQQTAVRLLLIVSTQHSHIYYQTISELLRKSYLANPNGLGAIIRIIGGQSGVVEFPSIKPGLQMVLEAVLLQEQFKHTRLANENQSEALNTFKNLNMLTKMQKRHTFQYMKQSLLPNVLNDCLPKILQILEVTVTKVILRMNKLEEEVGQNSNKQNNEFNSERKKKKTIGADVGAESMDVDNAENDTKVIIGIPLFDTDDGEEEETDTKRRILAHTIIDLLNTIEAGLKGAVMRTTEVLKLSILSVRYFFLALTEKSHISRSAAVNRAYLLLARQCSARKAARSACIRELVEGALFYYGYLFGQYEEPEANQLDIPEHEMVLLQNQRHSLGPNANRTVLHAGVIGRGLRSDCIAKDQKGCPAETQTLLLKALDACCTVADKQNSVEGYSMISLMLVEMVSTDVMYNGLPFPDEEFTKVTMERDLMIRRAFSTSPVLWALLGFIAAHRPALCFSSVLLRAMCATCLHQWRAKNVNKFQPFDPNDELMHCTKKLLQLLAMGQLLPPPLSNLHVIIKHFEPPEIALLLKECVWNYLKDHVPSPALFHVDNNDLHWRNPHMSRTPPQYVDTLRNLMQKKLTKLGQHYYQMFIMPELNDSDTTQANLAESAMSKGEVEIIKA